jgi:ribonuclease Z
MELPRPKIPREDQQEQFLRDMEIDPHLYYPPDADRKIATVWPEEGVEMDVKTLLKAKGVDVDAE